MYILAPIQNKWRYYISSRGQTPKNDPRPLRTFFLWSYSLRFTKGIDVLFLCNAGNVGESGARHLMIDFFESSVRIHPDETFFTFCDEGGNQLSYTYKQARLVSAALARRLKKLGVRQGEMVVVDLPNCPEFVFLVLAVAYEGYTLVTLKHSLTEGEKLARVLELERDNYRIGLQVDVVRARQLMPNVRDLSADDSAIIEAIYGASNRGRSIMGERQDIVDDTIHFAERAAHLFDSSSRAGIMFTAGTTGKSKAVPLTWEQLVGASAAANESLTERGRELWQAKLPLGSSSASSKSASLQNTGGMMPQVFWQCVLPLYHIYGFQVLVRSVVGRTPLRIYENFDAERILFDGEQFQVTHISVSDRMLQDLLTVEEWRCDIQPTASSRLREYQCILLSGHKLNPRTIERGLDIGARMFACYGMTETSSLIATSLVTPQFRGGLRLMDGYTVHIVDPDEEGFGRLAVKGPGVFDGYLNASAAFTVDHYFITGDTAALYDGCIYVKNRSANMFVCAGENVYPEEIADMLRHVPGVSAAHVFGVADAKVGRRPIAVVERENASVTAQMVERTAQPWLAGQNALDSVLVVDALPRLENGKIDRPATEAMFRDRLQIQKVILHHIRVPFTEPLQTALGVLEHRDSVVVEVVDALGRVGLGECVAFDAKWGLDETLPLDVRYIQETIVPALLGRVFLHPRDAAEVFSKLLQAQDFPMAISAIENALWDLFGQATEKPLWKLIGEEYERLWTEAGLKSFYDTLPVVSQINGNSASVKAAAIIGLAPTPVAMQHATSAVAAGYRRVKMKIAPGVGYASVQAVRRAFPNLLITLDANRSFTDENFEELKAYDPLNIGWIEEPFDVSGGSTELRRDPLQKMESMQPYLATPLCVDESYANAAQAERILQFPEIRCISVKPSKFGGIVNCLDFMVKAKASGRVVWIGGMYGLGISRRVSAAFETLPDMIFPGDIGATQRYFASDITTPAYTASHGTVVLNDEGYGYGLGCTLDEEALREVEVEQIVLE